MVVVPMPMYAHVQADVLHLQGAEGGAEAEVQEEVLQCLPAEVCSRASACRFCPVSRVGMCVWLKAGDSEHARGRSYMQSVESMSAVAASWKCPACLGHCLCAACERRHEEDVDEKVRAPPRLVCMQGPPRRHRQGQGGMGGWRSRHKAHNLEFFRFCGCS